MPLTTKFNLKFVNLKWSWTFDIWLAAMKELLALSWKEPQAEKSLLLLLFLNKHKEILAQPCFPVHFYFETKWNQNGTVNFSAASMFIMGQQNSLFCLFKCKPIKSKANTQLLKSYSPESDGAGGKTLIHLSLHPSSPFQVHSNSRQLPLRRTKPCCSS